MKICAAQIKPVTGDISANIKKHGKLIEKTISLGADLVIFPELSLTGYEPKLANELATGKDDVRFNLFQEISDSTGITIGAGIPMKAEYGTHISMLIFQPHLPRTAYSKQHLHADELPYFVPGNIGGQIEITNTKIFPAICYESLLPEHAARAHQSGASVYLASVAKSAKGVEKAFNAFPKFATRYSMTVIMSNAIGLCDDFMASGNSAVWNNRGQLAGQLDQTSEGVLVFDTDTETTVSRLA